VIRHASLEEVCVFITDGTHFTPRTVPAGIPFVTVKDVSERGLDFDGCAQISAADYEAAEASRSAPHAGDVLFSKDGTVGKVHVVATDRPFAVLSSLAILRPDSACLDAAYLGRALKSEAVLRDAVNRKTGSAIRRIVLADLKKVRIPLPDLPTQRRIAATLDRADEVRARRRAAIAIADTLAGSIFETSFGRRAQLGEGWALGRLRDFVSLLQIGPFGSLLHESDYVTGGVPIVNPSHIHDGRIAPNPQLTIAEATCLRLGQYRMRAGDVVMGRRGEMGRCAVVQPREDGYLCGTGSLFVRPKPAVTTSGFLVALLASPSIKRSLERAALGATLPNLNSTIVGSLTVTVPPLKLQVAFDQLIESVHGISASITASATEMNLLFATLQHRAFTGEL
jgi:type I restriction enzyme, S subunit